MKMLRLIKCEQNVKEFAIDSMQEFHDLIRRNDEFKGYLFRGQKDASWKLESSIFRFRNYQEDYISTNMDSLLENFKIYARGCLNELNSLPDNQDEIWAIGQHYGLYTPLLDWSVSPYIAMYFALSDDGVIPRIENNDEFSVYFLNAKKLNQLYYSQIYRELAKKPSNKKYDISGLIPLPASDEDKGRMIEFLSESDAKTKPQIGLRLEYTSLAEAKLRIFSPKFGGNKRLLSQRGIFTISTLHKNMETAAEKCYPNEELIYKINIPGKFRPDAVKILNTMNINSMTMYPDISGAAKYANWKGISEVGTAGVMRKFIP